MNFYKPLAVLFALLTISSFREMMHVFNSTDSNIVENRSSLIPIAIAVTAGFIWATIHFWQKGKKKSF